MSFFLASRPCHSSNDPAEPHCQQDQYQLHGIHIKHRRHDDPARWAPAFDPSNNRHAFLVGRIALEADQWQAARNLSIEGGLACRWILELTRNLPKEEWGPAFNGNFGVIIWEEEQQRLHLITDRCGATPFYMSAPGLPWCIGSDPDSVASQLSANNIPVSLDKTTLAEVLIQGAANTPFTYYNEVSELEAATHYQFELETGDHYQSTYWQPQFTHEDNKEDALLLAEELASALRNAVKRRTFGKTGLLLSGGADSRAILFAADHPETITTATFFDEPNPELDIARKLAAAANAKHFALQRAFDHYGDAMEQVVHMTGGRWSVKDVHYHGFQETLLAQEWDSLLTGCYADYLLKGLALNTRQKRFMGFQGTVQELDDYGPEFYQPHAPISEYWAEQVNERSSLTHQLIQSYPQDPSAVEDLRVRPLSREPDAMGRLYLQQCLPWDPIILDNDILAFYQRLAPSQKLNGKVFRMAVHLITKAQAGHIPNNNDGTHLLAKDHWKMLRHFISRLQLRGRRLLGKVIPGFNQPSLTTKGSWPNFSYYVANSDVIANLWANPHTITADLFNDLLGYDPWKVSLAEWGSDDTKNDLFLRLLTLKIWLEKSYVGRH